MGTAFLHSANSKSLADVFVTVKSVTITEIENQKRAVEEYRGRIISLIKEHEQVTVDGYAKARDGRLRGLKSDRDEIDERTTEELLKVDQALGSKVNEVNKQEAFLKDL